MWRRNQEIVGFIIKIDWKMWLKMGDEMARNWAVTPC
jgi:hypothetical protein